MRSANGLFLRLEEIVSHQVGFKAEKQILGTVAHVASPAIAIAFGTDGDMCQGAQGVGA